MNANEVLANIALEKMGKKKASTNLLNHMMI